jgi:hypothetical protein
MPDGLGKVAPAGENQSQVRMGLGVVRLQAQGVLPVRDGFGLLSLDGEVSGQIVIGEGRPRINAKCMRPQRPRVASHLDLSPREALQAEQDAHGEPAH